MRTFSQFAPQQAGGFLTSNKYDLSINTTHQKKKKSYNDMWNEFCGLGVWKAVKFRVE
jgi:hypothetical protein